MYSPYYDNIHEIDNDLADVYNGNYCDKWKIIAVNADWDEEGVFCKGSF